MSTAKGITNVELMKVLDLPTDTITKLQTAQGKEFEAVANQFIDKLFNKVIYQTVDAMDFSNPFKKYDSFPVVYGDTIENIFVEMPEGYKFDKDASDPFTKANPSVQSLYASINYEMQYETTIQDSLLRRACINEYGFMNLIDTILSTLVRKMNIDEYFATIAMLNNQSLYANGFETITVGASKEETAKIITSKIVDVATDLQLPSDDNNVIKTDNATPSNRILLIIKQSILNSVNIDYLTGVFNLSKVDLVKNIIPVKSFQVEDNASALKGEDIDFIILDTKGFDNHVALQDGGMIYNPKGKYTNHFTNLWKIISYKYFYNARAFKLSAKLDTLPTKDSLPIKVQNVGA